MIVKWLLPGTKESKGSQLIFAFLCKISVGAYKVADVCSVAQNADMADNFTQVTPLEWLKLPEQHAFIFSHRITSLFSIQKLKGSMKCECYESCHGCLFIFVFL